MKHPGIKTRLIALGRIIVTGFKNLFRNAWLTLAAIAVMVVTLTIVQVGGFAYSSLNDTIDESSRRLTVSVYLQDKFGDEGSQQLEQAFNDAAYIDGYSFKTKSDALKDFQNRYGETNPALLEGIGLTDENPLPASYEVVLSDVNEFNRVVELANSDEFSEVVLEAEFNDLKRDSFNAFINAREFFARASIIGGIVFGSISVLIIFNTIRMAVFTRSNEIEIMKLIGATPHYIKGPFLFESILYGLIAAAISLSAVYSAITALGPRLNNDYAIADTMDFFVDQWYIVVAVIVSLGVAIGFVSSYVALGKYLRIKNW